MDPFLTPSAFDLAGWAWKGGLLMARGKGPLILDDVSARKQPSGEFLVRIRIKNGGRKREYSAKCVRLGDYDIDPFPMCWEDAADRVLLDKTQKSYLNVAFVNPTTEEMRPVRPGWANESTRVYSTHNSRRMAGGRLTLDISFQPNRRHSRAMGLEIVIDGNGVVTANAIPPCQAVSF